MIGLSPRIEVKQTSHMYAEGEDYLGGVVVNSKWARRGSVTPIDIEVCMSRSASFCPGCGRRSQESEVACSAYAEIK